MQTSTRWPRNANETKHKTIEWNVCIWKSRDGWMELWNARNSNFNVEWDTFSKLDELVQNLGLCARIGIWKMGIQIYRNLNFDQN